MSNALSKNFTLEIVEHRGKRLFFHRESGRAVAEIPLARIQRRTPLPIRRGGRPVRANFFKYEMQASAVGLMPGDTTELRLSSKSFERITHKNKDAAIDNYVVDEHGRRIILQMRPMFDSEQELDDFIRKHHGKTYDEILVLAKKKRKHNR